MLPDDELRQSANGLLSRIGSYRCIGMLLSVGGIAGKSLVLTRAFE